MNSPHPEATALIARLGLEPLPHEGGFFRRTWTSRETFFGGRPAGTAIYFLLTPGGFSALHRLDADELWHFHCGDPVEHLQLSRAETPTCVSLLGPDPLAGHIPQLLVPAGVWQGARILPQAQRGWSLLSCTMSPGWHDRGFELGSRPALIAEFPLETARISALSRVL